ncbi:sugar MFS transporter [Asticcacaulis sp. AND118]|uniref:sugar MFS transporter n=1 Tax=Asticcacaulis sp. AND118 TaxID=2840468 RepID=UPI001CFF88DE|nr:sugar MFS transporter [Asticcacaulis sp. AND118]UDF02859.1 sugar MFS transporter [Asticcacaulis sp. AND118]
MNAPTPDKAPSPFVTMGLIGLMFFIFGFVTWLNGPLITFVKFAFDLDDVGSFMVLMVFYMSYFVLALPSAFILKLTGMKKGMALGLLVMAAGAVMFGQFATHRIYVGAMTGLFTIGAGLALLQTAANPYISIVGPIESAAQRIAVMGIFNKLAGITAPFVFGALVMSGITEFGAQLDAAADPAAREALLSGFAQKVLWPYMGMAALLVALALFVLKSPLPELKGESKAEITAQKGGQKVRGGLFAHPNLFFGVLCIFLYVGVEVMAGDAIGTYGAAFGLPLNRTVLFTSLTLGGMLVGYIVGWIVIPRFVSQEKYLAFSAVLGILFTLGAFLTRDYVSVGFVAALGFANAMMWPAIFPLGIRGLGRHTEIGSALMIMGICGGAVLPRLYVGLAETVPFQTAFLIVMAPAYLYILFFALFGSRVAAKAQG